MIGAKDLVSGVVHLVSLPEVYARVRGLLDDPRARMQDFASAISRDPALTARLVKIANSAMFGCPGRVETVSRAVTLLGTQQLHDLVLATSVARAFAGISPRWVDVQTFWRSSVYCGVVARTLAARCHVLDVARLFVEGLLRDIGHLVIYSQIPDQAGAALQRATETGAPIAEVEREVLGFDYAEVGGELLRSWKVPETLHTAVRFHVDPEGAPGSLFETAIVHIAGVLTEAFATGVAGTGATARVRRVAWDTSGLDAESAAAIAIEAAEEVTGTVELVVGTASASAAASTPR